MDERRKGGWAIEHQVKCTSIYCSNASLNCDLLRDVYQSKYCIITAVDLYIIIVANPAYNWNLIPYLLGIENDKVKVA